jgi:hypothetical protein
MASSSNDPTTGAPVFLDSDAPDPAVNPSEVAAYAGSVGTRLIGSTAERTGYEFAREGLRWWDTTLDAEYLHNGTGWVRVFKAKTTFTPGFSNFTIGNSTVTAWYQIVGNLCQGVVRITLGSTFAMNTSEITMNAPVTAVNYVDADPVGTIGILDNGFGYYSGPLLMGSSGVIRLKQMKNSGAGWVGAINNGEPIGWAVGDKFSLQFSYEVA